MRPRWPVAVLSLTLLTAGLTACESATGQEVSPVGATQQLDGQGVVSTPSPTVSAAQIMVSPADGKQDVRLDSAISVAADQGRLVTVVVKDGEGNRVEGKLSADRASWKPSEAGGLTADTTYKVTATALDANSLKAVRRTTFTTMTPKRVATAYLTPGDDWNVGVGMPVIVTLSSPVADGKRDAVEDAISVTSKPSAKGAWRWFSDSQLQWRPSKFWKTGTKVKVEADLQGVQFAKGTWGEGTRKAAFTIGSRMTSTVDMDRHTLTVRKNGKTIRVIPITTGKRGFETREGIKVIMSRESSRQMNSETTGIGRDSAEYYNVNVKWAMRLTHSGEFLHAAPWSVGSQGRANVSHGCTGMSTANAAWLFSVSKVGDVVKYVGGSRQLEWGNGYTAWNRSFKEWKAGA